MTGINYMQIVRGSEKYYCRVEGCMAFTWKNLPYAYCEAHLAQYLRSEPLLDKLGFPPMGES